MTTTHPFHPNNHGGPTTSQRRMCLSIAGVCAIGVVAFTAWAPVDTVNTGQPGVQPRFSIVHVHGTSALLAACIPAVVTLLVAALLAVAEPHRVAYVAAWILAIALTVAALAGTVTLLIGVVALPTAGTLVAACATPRSERS